MLIQIILSLFLLFALSRVLMQLRQGKLTVGTFLFWVGLFVFALTGVLSPEFTQEVARLLGIGRGTDVAMYLSIALLFYLIFRLSITIEETRREITELFRKLALNEKNITKPRRLKQRKRQP